MDKYLERQREEQRRRRYPLLCFLPPLLAWSRNGVELGSNHTAVCLCLYPWSLPTAEI